MGCIFPHLSGEKSIISPQERSAFHWSLNTSMNLTITAIIPNSCVKLVLVEKLIQLNRIFVILEKHSLYKRIFKSDL